jgi:hypothetical protein
MSVVPVTINGIAYPKNKKDPPFPVTIVGQAWISGLKPSTGPVPPGAPPPLEIWGDLGEYIDAGFPVPQPPPSTPDNPEVPKPVPPGGGWAWSPDFGWIYVPGSSAPGPKK